MAEDARVRTRDGEIAALDPPRGRPYLRQMSRDASRRLAGLLAAAALLLGGAPRAHAEPESAATAASSRLERARALVRAVERDMVGLLERVDRGSVSLLSCQRLRVGGGRADEYLLSGAGSAVIVTHRGTHLVTNAHVVGDCDRIEAVTPDGQRHVVGVLAFDKDLDLALLDVPGSLRTLVPVSLANTRDAREGMWVVAAGNPFLLAMDGQSVATLGVVSGLRRPREGYSIVSQSIQHDAEINPGNSGGPLWSLSGELLGINGAIVTRQQSGGAGPSYSGASFSVPVAEVRAFIDRALDSRAPRRTDRSRPGATPRTAPPTRPQARDLLGITYRSTYDRHGRRLGALVESVRADSPLRPARSQRGVVAGDIITGVERAGRSYSVTSAEDLERALDGHRGGSNASVRVKRGQRTYRWTGPLGG